ncbi:MAG: type II toxin-antitoxin system Phd/YefM family antitoxin [Gammaproteobacteria bacterium]|nr:type II toxin-antitoxin system Phd/YefM family antitoxin [Gammaproteobacteria bacterium]
MPKNAIAVGEFKAKCLKLITKVHDEGKPLLLTKRGKAYAELIPIREKKQPFNIVGCMEGSAEILGDIIAPIDVEWDAEK